MGWFSDIFKKIREWFRKILDWIRKIFGLCTPRYGPEEWNDWNGIQYNNNCYNYACNIQTGTYAQPGRASGNGYSAINCAEVTDGAISDGLKEHSPCNDSCSGCCHTVALAMDTVEPRDYHWYRLDRDGTWSHKPGWGEATNLDNSGNIITDPRTADRGRYNEFCGCFCVCKNEVTIH